MKKYFVTAIGTDSGKTITSAILCRALRADYWKPVQAGRPTDTEKIRSLTHAVCHPERYLLEKPASPHFAAESAGINISLDDFELPKTENTLVIEGAGGLMVPLNDKQMVIDLAAKFQAEIILVCNIYLGSINHSLLSIEKLKRSGIPVAGIVFNGEDTPSTESIISKHAPWPVLLRIRPEKQFGEARLDHYAKLFLNLNG